MMRLNSGIDIVCPRDYSDLNEENNVFRCHQAGHEYPVVEGVPVMLIDDVDQTIGLCNSSILRAKGEEVDQRSPELYLESIGISEEEKELLL